MPCRFGCVLTVSRFCKRLLEDLEATLARSTEEDQAAAGSAQPEQRRDLARLRLDEPEHVARVERAAAAVATGAVESAQEFVDTE